MDERAVASLDGSEIRVDVSVPRAFAIDPSATRLRVALSSAGSEVEADLDLELASTQRGSRGGGWFSAPDPVRSYRFKLGDAALAGFARMQQMLASEPVESLQFKVDWRFSTVPPRAEAVSMWVDLQLDADEKPFTLVDGARIVLE